ncbi:MAG: hypothetical protein ACT4N9_06555 [Paracoccaceae bacterium]
MNFIGLPRLEMRLGVRRGDNASRAKGKAAALRFPERKPFVQNYRPFRLNPDRLSVQIPDMDQMTYIPKDRQPLRTGRICLLIGLTGLLYVVLSERFGGAANALSAFVP